MKWLSTREFTGWAENTNTDYHSGEGLGSTQIKDFIENPGLFYHRHVAGNRRKETPQLSLGKLVHSAILEPQTFLKNYVVQPDFGNMQSSTNRAKRDSWRAEQPPTAIICTQEERQMLIDMCDSICSHPTAYELLKQGVAERSGYWNDPETGLLLKCRPDFFRAGAITVDLKTCRSSKYHIFQKDALKYGYPVSAAHYLAGATAIEKQPHTDFVFIAVETEAPYTTEVFIADETMLEYGEKKRRHAINGIAKCVKDHNELVTKIGNGKKAWPITTNPTHRLEPMNLTLPTYAEWE